MFTWVNLWSRGRSVDVVTWWKRADRLWEPPSLLWNGYWEFPLGCSGRSITLSTRLHQSVEVRKEWAIPLLPVYALVACTCGNWPFQIPCKHAAKMTFRSGVWTPVNVREFCIYYIILYYIMLRCVILYYIILCYIYIMLCCVVLCCVILYYIILYYIILYYIILYYIILYYIIL